MSGVGRGRGAVLPAWMKAKGDSAPGAAPQEAAPGASLDKMPPIGSKRSFDTVNAPSPATAIAVATSPTALPPGWHENFDPTYQQMYYYNYSTGERTWTKPQLVNPNHTSAPAATAVPAPKKPAPAPQAVPKISSAPPSLPASARWEKAIDPARGKPYYYNHATGESAWELPEGATLLTTTVVPVYTAPVNSTAAPPIAEKQQEEEPEEGEVGHIPQQTIPSETLSHSPEEITTGKTRINNEIKTTTRPLEAALREEEREAAPLLPPLPQGWSEAQDPASGNTYYYNQQLNITQWHRPGKSELDTAPTQQPQQQQRPAVHNNNAAAVGGGGRGGNKVLNNSNIKSKAQGALDPMDPSSYSDTPRGGWGAGLGKETDM